MTHAVKILIVLTCLVFSSNSYSNKCDKLLTLLSKTTRLFKAKNGIIVDAYSSSSTLPMKFKKYGIVNLKHIQTHSELLDLFKSSFKATKDQYKELITLDKIDKEKLILKLKKEKIDFVIAGSETGVHLADEISERLSIASNGTKLTMARRDKYLMGETIRNAGIDAVKQFKTNNISEALKSIAKNLNYPVIVKPIDGACTSNVNKCYNDQDVIRAFKTSLGKKHAMGKNMDELLVQEYLEGPEYVVNTVGIKNIHIISDIWEYQKKEVKGASDIYDRDILLPFRGEVQDQLVAYAKKVIKAVEIANGPTHIEIKYVPGRGPVLIEIGSRMGGSNMPKISSYGLPKNYNQADLTARRYSWPLKFFITTMFRKVFNKGGYDLKKHVHIVTLNAPKDGLKLNLKAIEKVKELASFKELSGPSYKDGEEVKKTIDMVTAVGEVILAHENIDQLNADYQQIRLWEETSFFD